MDNDRTACIRALNDELRHLQSAGHIFITYGVASAGPQFVKRAMRAIAGFDAFDEDNDPYGEHDFGALAVGDVLIFWKIDYYDLSLMSGADDPSDSQKCRRVLTVMLAAEY